MLIEWEKNVHILYQICPIVGKYLIFESQKPEGRDVQYDDMLIAFYEDKLYDEMSF